MQVVKWEKSSRNFSQEEIDDFYERPLDEPTLFRFTTSKIALPAHGGAFSLKIVLSGEEHYEIGNRHLTVRPGEFLFINEGETYASSIEEKTESISIFAPSSEASPAIKSAVAKINDVLDQPSGCSSEPEVGQILFKQSPHAISALKVLKKAIDAGDTLDTRQQTQFLMAEALCDLFQYSPPRTFEKIKKRSTRDELRSRIMRAKRTIDDTNGQFANLDDLASIACLSKYHFLRYFSSLYGISPAAYARRRRLEEAGRTIGRIGNIGVAARRAGYKDKRAFERAYRRILGTPLPSVE